jgi:hypothetical protein
MSRGNPNPKQKLKPRIYEETMAEIPLSVRVDAKTAEYVRSLPNRTEWLRKAIAAQVERDREQQAS